MLSWIIGILLIISGILWPLFCLFAAGMADTQSNMMNDVLKPGVIPGVIAVILGILIIVFR